MFDSASEFNDACLHNCLITNLYEIYWTGQNTKFAVSLILKALLTIKNKTKTNIS